MVRVAINGFGRIGRQAFKAMFSRKDIEIIAVNDLVGNEALARLLHFDSVYGRFNESVEFDSKHLIVGGEKIVALAEANPSKLPWKKLGVDVVLESTGVFRNPNDAAKHLSAGAKKVVITAPPKGAVCGQYILNINTRQYDPRKEHVVSMASCTTNCLAPMVKVVHEGLGIVRGFMTTVHAYTADQVLVDGPHRDPRRARAAAINIVPTSTGAAEAITSVFPDLRGKLDGIALRVPVASGSVTDFTCTVSRETSVEEVNSLFKRASKGKLKKNLEYSSEELVSTDILGNPHGCVFDSKLTRVSGDAVKVFGWYDNEFGYSSLLAEFVLFLNEKGF